MTTPGVTGPGQDPAAPRRSVTVAVAGVLTLVYVVWCAVDLIVLRLDPVTFNRVHRDSGGFVPRVVVAGLGLAVLFHATDGLGGAVVDLWPRLGPQRVRLAALARFVTLAAGIPGAVAVVWPAVRVWWST